MEAQELKARILVNNEVILDKVFQGWGVEDIQRQLALYIQDEQLTKLGEVRLQVMSPVIG